MTPPAAPPRPIEHRPIEHRPIEHRDLAALAVLNDAAVPSVNRLGLDGISAHLPLCDLAVVADDDNGRPAGFLLGLAPGAPYASENYRWFETHRPGSLYVGRIVVAPHAHRRGIGRVLYGAAIARAAELALAEVTCEVNLDPPNPGSLAFHGRLGFVQVAEQVTKGGSVRVALMARTG